MAVRNFSLPAASGEHLPCGALDTPNWLIGGRVFCMMAAPVASWKPYSGTAARQNRQKTMCLK